MKHAAKLVRPTASERDEHDMLLHVAVRVYERRAGHPATIRPFNLPEHVNKRYLRGQCAAFAVAVRKASGLPLWGMFEAGTGHLHHVFAFDPYNLAAIDVRGHRPIETIAEGSCCAGGFRVAPVDRDTIVRFLGYPTKSEILAAAGTFADFVAADLSPDGVGGMARALAGKPVNDALLLADELEDLAALAEAGAVNLEVFSDSSLILLSDIERLAGSARGAGIAFLKDLTAIAERHALPVAMIALGEPSGRLVRHYETVGFRLRGDLDGGGNPYMDYEPASLRLTQAVARSRIFSNLVAAGQVTLDDELAVAAGLELEIEIEDGFGPMKPGL